MIPIPSTSKDLTPQWFTSILKLKGINHVTSVNLQPLGEADSVSGDIYRVRLTYSNKILHNPESVVIKLPRPRNQRTSMLLDAYRVEVSFYRTIAPTIGVRVPKHIYSDIDPETSDYVLVIEDFPDSTNVRNETGATIDQAYKLLEYMAKLHAWYWLKPDLVGYKWPYSLNEKLIDQTVSEISKCLTLFLSRFGEYIQTGEYGVLEALPEYYKSAVKPLLKSPMTLVHNDFAMKNILIIDRGDRTYPVLVDWANVARAPGVRDLSFFIQTSIAPRTRSLKEMELLRHYWGRHRIEGVSDYSFDSMVLDYRRSVLIDLFRMVRFGGREFFRPMYESIVRHDLLCRTGSAEELDLLSLLQENHK